jgi:tripartite-type tricarboxylate transporter receptor subunit TctC
MSADIFLIGEAIMRLFRRKFLQLVTTGIVGIAAPSVTWAQAYPTRPIRLLVGYSAGGPTDITARLIGQYLSTSLGQPIIVDNRPGASGTIATQAAVNEAGDGYTLILLGAWDTINATLYSNLKYNFINDIAPVAGLIRYSNVMEVPSSFPAKTVSEFIS